MVERKFHSVGHGGFITEKINNRINIVYDCGGKNKSIIEREINQYFSVNDEILAVFISHFHRDHVNGLEYLLNRCRVRNLFIPLFDDTTRIFFLMSHNISPNSFIGRLILDPFNTLANYEDLNIILVRENNDNEESNLELEEIHRNLEIESGVRIRVSRNIDWYYIIFNLNSINLISRFRLALSNAGININNITNNSINNTPITRNFIRSLRTVWNNTIGTGRILNENSMVLYSGPLQHRAMFHTINNLTIRSNNPLGALYLGDYEANRTNNFDALKLRYCNVWDNIRFIQVPHHGAIANHNIDLYSNNKICIVFANGSGAHPSTRVVNDITNRGGISYLVTSTPQNTVTSFNPI